MAATNGASFCLVGYQTNLVCPLVYSPIRCMMCLIELPTLDLI